MADELYVPEVTPRTVKKFKYRLVLEALAIGIAAGLIVTAYKYALEKLESASKYLYAAAMARPLLIIAVAVALCVLAFIAALLIQLEPWSGGGGIAQVKEQIRTGRKVCFWRVALCKFAGGAISMFAGLGLGREGPSVQLGAESADGLAAALKRGDEEKRFLLACGAGAGIAAAFTAPFAGAIMALEEFRREFSPASMLSSLASSFAATITAYLLGGSIYGDFSVHASALPLRAYGFAVIAAVILGFFGLGYNVLLLLVSDKTKKIKNPRFLVKARAPLFFKLLPIFLIAGAAALFIPIVSYDGHDILSLLFGTSNAALSAASAANAAGAAANTMGSGAAGIAGFSAITFIGTGGIAAVGLILLFQVAFTLVCFSSGATGGNFFPVMVSGALVGALAGLLFSRFMGMDASYVAVFTLLGMVGSLTAVTRVPFTAVALAIEMTGSAAYLLPFALTALVAYVIPDLFNTFPLYEALMLRLPKAPDRR